MDQPIIRLRPHHALCLRHYIGQGYDAAFMQNSDELKKRLSTGERVMVQVILHRDSLCAACPHDHNGTCHIEDKVRAYDRAVAVSCGLRSGQWLSWQELCALIDDRVLNAGGIKSVCADCEWFPVCENQEPSKL